MSESCWPDGVPQIMPAADRAEIEELFARYAWGIGTRDDRLVKENGRWKFWRLTVNAWTQADQVPWKGERTIPLRPQYSPPPADTRPFHEQAQDPF